MSTSRNLTVLLIVSMIAASAVSVVSAKSSIPQNVNVSQRAGNESEEAIAVNPTNPNNIVIFTNIAEGVNGMFLATSFDGGRTWNKRIVGEGNDVFGDTCCDPSLSFDEYGNLFMTYLYNVDNLVPVALSTDGGLTFSVIANIGSPAGLAQTKGARSERGLFRFVDQPTIISGHGEVWVIFNAGGPMFATGAPVTGLGQVGSFFAGEVAPGTNNCTYGDISIGPAGQVMQVCTLTESGQGGGKLRVNVDPDGLGPAGFGDRVDVVDTHIGGFDFIPPQPDRSVDAEPGLAWDRSGGPHNGRVYLVYSIERPNESDDIDIYVRYSDNNGATWSNGVRVNDDHTNNSQFMPKISLDQTTGNLAVVWYDSRADLGSGGTGDTNGIPNDDAQFWGSFSTDGGISFTANFQISAGTSNSHFSGNGIDYADYD
ncbi:MAG TPA: sialidase family protein, partial [Anaerolineales bacterium]|nr:sialidase family protein [Anaerolineales bacterium]